MIVCPICKSANIGSVEISSPDGYAGAQLYSPGSYSRPARLKACLDCGVIFIEPTKKGEDVK